MAENSQSKSDRDSGVDLGNMGAQIAHDPGGAARLIVRLRAENARLQHRIECAGRREPRSSLRKRVVQDPVGAAHELDHLYDEVSRLRAGISHVRGMCTDEEPHHVIDAKLGEVLNGD